MLDDNTEFVRVTLADPGMTSVNTFSIEVVPMGGETRISNDGYSFEDFAASLEALTRKLHDTIKKIEPTKASIEFGIEVGVEAGKLTALLVKGSGKANLKVILEWS